MSQKAAPSHAISGVFVFLLLGIFAVFSTVMVLLGAKAYKSTADRAAEHNAGRIAGAYMRSMVRSDDEAGSIVLEDLGDVHSVTLRHVYDEDEYLTRLYVYGGVLREWFSYGEAEFKPEDGEPVCDVDEMTAEITDGLLSVGIRNGEKWSTVDVALRAAAEN